MHGKDRLRRGNIKEMIEAYDMDEVTCVTTNKVTDWWMVFYHNHIKDDPPDEVWMYMKEGVPGDDDERSGEVKCKDCPKRVCGSNKRDLNSEGRTEKFNE